MNTWMLKKNVSFFVTEECYKLTADLLVAKRQTDYIFLLISSAFGKWTVSLLVEKNVVFLKSFSSWKFT